MYKGRVAMFRALLLPVPVFPYFLVETTKVVHNTTHSRHPPPPPPSVVRAHSRSVDNFHRPDKCRLATTPALGTALGMSTQARVHLSPEGTDSFIPITGSFARILALQEVSSPGQPLTTFLDGGTAVSLHAPPTRKTSLPTCQMVPLTTNRQL